MKICGIVIWYNPQKKEVDNIKSYINHIDKLIVVDNSQVDNTSMLKDINGIDYIPNRSNLGIARALNIGCKKAIIEGYNYVLTMDQDSSFDEEMIMLYINKSKEMKCKDKLIAIFAPKTSEIEEYGYVDKVITSGNILNLNAYMDVNGFDDDLFIDEVDHDLCFKLIDKKYKIYKFEDITLRHNLGHTTKIRIFNREFSCMNHNYIRKYYIIRNRFIVKKRYPKHTKKYNRNNIVDFIKVILGEDDKVRRVKYMIKGYLDYKHNKLGKL